MDIGFAVGRKQGVTEEKLRALSDFECFAPFTPEEEAVLRYADAMTLTPVRGSDELFAALRGFYEEAKLVELTSAIAWENYRARFDHALAMEAEGFS